MIARMENRGYLIEVQFVTPPDDLKVKDCPWRHPETCKACESKPCKNNKEGVNV
jgi:hypothetical protein